MAYTPKSIFDEPEGVDMVLRYGAKETAALMRSDEFGPDEMVVLSLMQELSPEKVLTLLRERKDRGTAAAILVEIAKALNRESRRRVLLMCLRDCGKTLWWGLIGKGYYVPHYVNYRYCWSTADWLRRTTDVVWSWIKARRSIFTMFSGLCSHIGFAVGWICHSTVQKSLYDTYKPHVRAYVKFVGDGPDVDAINTVLREAGRLLTYPQGKILERRRDLESRTPKQVRADQARKRAGNPYRTSRPSSQPKGETNNVFTFRPKT